LKYELQHLAEGVNGASFEPRETQHHPVAGRPREGGERPPAGDQHPRGRAGQFRREPGETGSQAGSWQAESGSAALPGSDCKLEAGLELVQQSKTQGADGVAREAIQLLRAGELRLPRTVDGSAWWEFTFSRH
jgi:hypothetical protein